MVFGRESKVFKHFQALLKSVDHGNEAHQRMENFFWDKLCSMIFTSNRIEGSKTTFKDTVRILNEYRSVPLESIQARIDEDIARSPAQYKHLRREVLRHYAAFTYLHAQPKNEFSLKIILNVHKILMDGAIHEDTTKDPVKAGVLRDCPMSVDAGLYIAPSPADVEVLMPIFVDDVKTALKDDTMNPFLLAAFVASNFVDIHPFEDGNGRTSRLLMNYVLLAKGLPFPVLTTEKKYLKIIREIQQRFWSPQQKYAKAWCWCCGIVYGTWSNFYNISEKFLPAPNE